jgi:putative PIN family toxin of toxin-antitoxin system
MSGRKSSKIIFDTNIWISFLIGKRLQFIKDLIASHQLIVIISEQLLLELKMVAQRPKLKEYFPEQKVEELIQFLLAVGQKHEPNLINLVSRDQKTIFYLTLLKLPRRTT